METTPFDLTPTQKGIIASLAHRTGRPAADLLAEALAELQGKTNGYAMETFAHQEAYKPIWERIPETFSDLSEEDLASFPAGGAAQVDHHAYGLPKR